jgi:hypothetical protein
VPAAAPSPRRSSPLVYATLAIAAPGAQHSSATAESHHALAAHAGTTHALTAHQARFQDAMRKLWEDHITWTRLAIISLAEDLPDLAATQARLLANQDDIGDAIKPYYGNAAGERLTTLLKQHITGAVALLQAAKSGDDAAIAKAARRGIETAIRTPTSCTPPTRARGRVRPCEP